MQTYEERYDKAIIDLGATAEPQTAMIRRAARYIAAAQVENDRLADLVERQKIVIREEQSDQIDILEEQARAAANLIGNLSQKNEAHELKNKRQRELIAGLHSTRPAGELYRRMTELEATIADLKAQLEKAEQHKQSLKDQLSARDRLENQAAPILKTLKRCMEDIEKWEES